MEIDEMTRATRSAEDITNDTIEVFDQVLAQLRHTMLDIESSKEALQSDSRIFSKRTIVSNVGTILGSELPLGLPLLRLTRNEAELEIIDARGSQQNVRSLERCNV